MTMTTNPVTMPPTNPSIAQDARPPDAAALPSVEPSHVAGWLRRLVGRS